MRLAIFDYGAGNLHSLSKALQAPGIVVSVETDPRLLLRADAIVLPGVGAFGPAAARLAPARAEIAAALAAGMPCLGICLGMQLLFDASDESPGSRGLGVIPGRVTRLRATRVPHMGWNAVAWLPSSAHPHGAIGRPGERVAEPASGAVVAPASGAVVEPASGAVVKPASGAVLAPASGVVEPASGAVVAPASGAVVEPASGAVVEPASGAVVKPAAGAVVERPSGGIGELASGAVVEPPSGAVVERPSGGIVGPASDVVVERPSGGGERPSGGVGVWARRDTSGTVSDASEARRRIDIAYFAHSYACWPTDERLVTAWTVEEPDRFPSAVRWRNVVGVQFHPEKSSSAGLRFIRDFLGAI